MLEIGGSVAGATGSEEAGPAPPGSERLRGCSSTVSAIGGATIESEFDSFAFARYAFCAGACAGEWLKQPQPEAVRSAQHATNLKVTSVVLSLS